jgi:peptide-methionine (S)-S-oxide reductase
MRRAASFFSGAKSMNTSPSSLQTAVLGGGCFWCLDAVFRGLDGVSSVESGYAGGAQPNPTYESVCGGRTGHAEVVRVTFDPSVVSFRDLLTIFFTIHDPTTKDRQGNDDGPQYRSAIFPMTDAQKKAAVAIKTRVEKSGAWKKGITTTIEPNPIWVKAEEYHQDYLVKHPGGYDNHFARQMSF